MQTTEMPAGQLSGAVLLYVNPEPLSVEAHGKLGIWRNQSPYRFASTTAALPLQVTEFGPAALTYPIIFAGSEYQPLAVTSVRPNENLFIDADGAYSPDAYVPAYVRRYPFVLANDTAGERLIVCIDRASESLTEGGEVALFENGEASTFTKSAIEFCSNFETERQRTDVFVKTLRDLDLFEEKKAFFTPMNPDGTQGEPLQIADYFAVSETKLNELPADKLVDLRNSGALQQIYAHMTSLFNWERLVTRTMVKYPNG